MVPARTALNVHLEREDESEDINEFILPILEDSIVAEFNERQINVYPHDNTESIFEKFKKVW